MDSNRLIIIYPISIMDKLEKVVKTVVHDIEVIVECIETAMNIKPHHHIVDSSNNVIEIITDTVEIVEDVLDIINDVSK